MVSKQLIDAAEELSKSVEQLSFLDPVTHVYNPLDYAWNFHKSYLQTYGNSQKRVLFLGMNPGPFGMVQTAIPFGEISAVRDWMKLEGSVGKPKPEHPKRPVEGFQCPRSEVSGKRLWGLFAERYGAPQDFFSQHFVVNYCPLAFMEESGRNRTPDKLPKIELEAVYKACDHHLHKVVAALEPEWLIGIGRFAFERFHRLFKENSSFKIATILHPSPASPAANRDWSGTATQQLQKLGIW